MLAKNSISANEEISSYEKPKVIVSDYRSEPLILVITYYNIGRKMLLKKPQSAELENFFKL